MRALRWVGLGTLVSLLSVGTQVRAQPGLPPAPSMDRSFDVQLFHPSVGTHGFITLDGAEVLEHKLFNFGLVANYERQPLSYTLATLGSPAASTTVVPVQNLSMAELSAAMGLFNRFEVGVALPLAISWGGDAYDGYGARTGPASNVYGVGDLRVEGKGEVVGFGPDRAFLLSLSAGGTLPTGDKSAFLGDKSVTGRARAMLEYQPTETLRAIAMLGGLFREKSEFLGSPQTHAMLYGAAAELRPKPEIAVLAEVTGRLGSKYSDTNPAEFDAGMRFYLPSMVNLLMGAGFGLNAELAVRSCVLSWGWAGRPTTATATTTAFRTSTIAAPTNPRITTASRMTMAAPTRQRRRRHSRRVDKCPNEPEDFDGFQDDDGCPDLDNDGDGIPDLNDACPTKRRTARASVRTTAVPAPPRTATATASRT
jgi:hypothetical protein